MQYIFSKRFFLFLNIFIIAPSFSVAHHPMDGNTPLNWGDGLISGIAHPIIGLDHIVFIACLGIISSVYKKKLLPAVIFIFSSALGSALIQANLYLPFFEYMLPVSIIFISILIIYRHILAQYSLYPLLFISGILHGHAYGKSIIGAESSPIIFYFLGFIIIQFIIVTVVCLIFFKLNFYFKMKNLMFASGLSMSIGSLIFFKQIFFGIN
tara:strand:- start:555 stop:1184 length:630 start_codon:yes stop_codon:yes gene_type:complete